MLSWLRVSMMLWPAVPILIYILHLFVVNIGILQCDNMNGLWLSQGLDWVSKKGYNGRHAYNIAYHALARLRLLPPSF
jgi:hypothetical protein